MKRVGITGERGTIGQVLSEGLRDGCEVVPMDLPEVDVRDLDTLLERFQGLDAVIHLAWNTRDDNPETGEIDPDNYRMALNVYKAAEAAAVPRVVVASSPHADAFRSWDGGPPLSPDRVPVPGNPYGAGKVFVEALGRHFATRGLEVVCIRFGGMNTENERPLDDPVEYDMWLSHGDCVSLLKACLEAGHVPDNFTVISASSTQRIVDTTNPFGWEPRGA